MTGFKSAISLFILIAFTGCGTMSQAPAYTAREKNALANAVIWQSADLLTTAMWMGQGKAYKEGNQIFGSSDSDGAMLTKVAATKTMIFGVTYFIGQIWPDARLWGWRVVALEGGLAAGFNLYQIGTH